MSELTLLEKINQTTVPVFLGVDCSSRAIHAVAVDEQERVVGKQKWYSSATDFDFRYRYLGVEFQRFIQSLKVPLVVAVESAIFIQNPKSTIEIATVVAGVRLGCAINNVQCIPVDNRHWKKLVLGKGNLNKTAIKGYTIEKWGDIFPEQDWSDASCIALWNKRRDK